MQQRRFLDSTHEGRPSGQAMYSRPAERAHMARTKTNARRLLSPLGASQSLKLCSFQPMKPARSDIPAACQERPRSERLRHQALKAASASKQRHRVLRTGSHAGRQSARLRSRRTRTMAPTTSSAYTPMFAVATEAMYVQRGKPASHWSSSQPPTSAVRNASAHATAVAVARIKADFARRVTKRIIVVAHSCAHPNGAMA
jgi:hypothetical protein